MVTVEQIERGVMSYVESEIAVKATGTKKFIVYFLLPSIPKKVEKMINDNRDMLSEYFDENGNVDIARVYENAKSAISKSGCVEMFGLRFNESDLDNLYRHVIQ